MALSRNDALTAVKETMFPAWRAEKDRLDRIDRWYRWEHEDVKVPRGATQEHRALASLAKTPWLNLVVSAASQSMYVDGWRSPQESRLRRSPQERDNRAPWQAWLRNGRDGRQVAVNRSALAYGYSYVREMPGVHEGRRAAVIRGVSPRRAYAAYQDVVEDEWPMLVLEVEASGREYLLRLVDEEAVYRFTSDQHGDELTYLDTLTHNLGVCPYVRVANADLEGRADGQVEPFIAVAARIDKTEYDRMLTQHFNSWKVRTIAGMDAPATDEDGEREALQLRQQDILLSDNPETKFGSLPETPMDGFIRAKEADVKSLAAVSQTPTHALTGDLINLSAEALAAARAELDRKVDEHKVTFGSGYDQVFRMAAFIEGDEASARNYEAHVTWQDTSIRSMAQAADALGKYAQMLQVPPRALWHMIPGVTKLDVDEWEQMAAEADVFALFANELGAGEQQAPPAA